MTDILKVSLEESEKSFLAEQEKRHLIQLIKKWNDLEQEVRICKKMSEELNARTDLKKNERLQWMSRIARSEQIDFMKTRILSATILDKVIEMMTDSDVKMYVADDKMQVIDSEGLEQDFNLLNVDIKQKAFNHRFQYDLHGLDQDEAEYLLQKEPAFRKMISILIEDSDLEADARLVRSLF